MSDTTLMYGGQSLTLTKSADLVGVKAERGRAVAVHQKVTHLGGMVTSENLGGFEVINVEDVTLPMEETLDLIRRDSDVTMGTHIYHTSDDGVPFVPTGQIYIRFAHDVSLSACQKLLSEHALTILEVRDERELIAKVTFNSENPVKVAAMLQASPLIEIAEPDLATPGKLTALVVPTDNGLAFQWHLHNTGVFNGYKMGLKAGADARVVDAWSRAQSLGNREVVIAVIDDGFDFAHPDLSGIGKVVAPWDFTRNTNNPIPDFSPGYNQWSSTSHMWTGDWHGTACAGLATGNANNGGILGAAPGSRLMPVRWGIDLRDSQVEAWFDYVRLQGAWVVSCSWGAAALYFPLSTRQQNAIARCAQNGRGGLGTIICFAAGNENRNVNDVASRSVNGFAIHPDVIAVAASTSMDERSHYSNYGAEISVCAPSSGAGGLGIVTSDVTGTFTVGGQQIGAGYSPYDFAFDFGGTSAATPIVAGVCALLLSVNPALTAKEVKSILQSTARKIGSAGGYDAHGHSPDFGYGCVDAAAAVATQLETHVNGTEKQAKATTKRRMRVKV